MHTRCGCIFYEEPFVEFQKQGLSSEEGPKATTGMPDVLGIPDTGCGMSPDRGTSWVWVHVVSFYFHILHRDLRNAEVSQSKNIIHAEIDFNSTNKNC